MLPEKPAITDSDRADILARFDDLHADLHYCIGILAETRADVAALKAELDTFAPVLAQLRGGVTLASARRARRAVSRLAVQEN